MTLFTQVNAILSDDRKFYKDNGCVKSEVKELSFVAKCFEDVHQILGIKVEPGKEPEILRELEKLPEVAAIYKSLGDYDLIALLSIEDSRELTKFVVETVRRMKGVVDTKTTLIRK
ncbi:MAG: hypothetical protein AYK18_07290 [Theionarchaea archaeon DG-70]|nr:MAG: hypothetical protein AYK18_07290 [Theionarchaea archaeon DG-70]